jgi:hypothetical protein
VIRSLPLFETFRSALTALASSVGGPAGLSALLGAHTRAGVPEAAAQLLDGSLEGALAAKRAQMEAAREALLAGWRGGHAGGAGGDRDGRDGDIDAGDMR